ncbi:unnamed protein product [Rhizophagus irregularis]|nr:unnamed protein product [Rhizophagus irregularis]
MIKRKTILLLLVPFLLNLVFCINFITAAQNDISRGVDIDRPKIPKNILFGSFIGRRSHVKPMLDIAMILAERGYNVILLASGNNVLSSEYPAVKQITLGPSTGMKNLGKDGIDEEQDYNAMKSLWEIACVDVANTLKKPVVVLFSALQNPKPYKFDPILGCNISLENKSIWERFRCNFIQVFRYVYSLSDFTNQLNEMRKQMNVDLGQLTLGGFKASLVLIDTFFGFELPQTLPPYIQELVQYYQKIWALVETTKDYFYPTLKLSDGTQIQTSQILNNEHPHIHIAEFVPQFAILNHTNTKLFFNHGSDGSAYESLYTGTPMLVLPFAGDQMGIALSIIGIIVVKLIKFIGFIISSSSDDQKSKKD